MGLKEILEAKKAAEAAAKTKESLPLPSATAQSVNAESSQKKEEEKKQEVAPKQVEKLLTFAEKLALKKAQNSQTTQPAPPAISSSAAPAPIPVSVDTTTPTAQQLNDKAASLAMQPTLATEAQIDTLRQTITDAANPQIEQAYSDIKDKINLLETASDTELPEQMKTIKKALMENPAAVSLMFDPDIGKMVIALRRITKEAMVEASKEKTKGNGKKDKSMPVDADAIARVFDEL
jgi:hypothetical protein